MIDVPGRQDSRTRHEQAAHRSVAKRSRKFANEHIGEFPANHSRLG